MANLGAVEQPVDARCLLERFILAETQVRRVAQVQRLGDLGADIFAVMHERVDHRLHIAAAERHDIDRCKLHIRRDTHFRNSDRMAGDDVVMHVAARQHFSDLVADQFANPQHALRWALARVFARFFPCHFTSAAGSDRARLLRRD